MTARRVPFCKLFCVGCLGALSLFLQVTLYTLNSYVADMKKAKLSKVQREKINTIRSSRPSESFEHPIYDAGASRATQAAAYWKQLLPYLDWERDDDSLFYSADVNGTVAVYLLRKAASLGHPIAQFLEATSLAAGFWFWPSDDKTLSVQEDWDLDGPEGHQAQILWQMSAIGGNVESALAMANRLEDSCTTRLPYLAAAAHGIMDQLLASPESRGRVVPAKDKHVLYQVHLHGGTGSRLDVDNRPDERADALQYYAVKATQLGDGADAARAAYTLARYYHLGLRGAPQNLTLALKYYDMAGNANHWEAAGRAGMMYLWGIGTKQDVVAAHKMFRVGTPGGFDGCQKRLKRKLKQGQDDEEISLCDSVCLTGMGLMYLLGVPMLAQRDVEIATSYLKLGKDQGDADASYYLGVMKLGWHTHYQSLDKLSEHGQTMVDKFPLVGESSHYPSMVDYQVALTELTAAAGKGNIMAKHRLAMMYETGIKIPNGSGNQMIQAVPMDCERAQKHYISFIDHASPQRAERLRRAYKQYVAGETRKSLQNYLIAAETGSDLGLLNAAFLMERGECLGLDTIACSKAAIRLWKAAAAKGYSEASLRVGDFFYYGRLRTNSNSYPFAWARFVFFPEKVLSTLFDTIRRYFSKIFHDLELISNEDKKNNIAIRSGSDVLPPDAATCDATNSDTEDKELDDLLNKDLSSAAHYYRLAAERNASPRAHFNLGFLYEWGFGLKQDFPLAKRHYDLAISTGTNEAELPVQVALFALNVHEQLVKHCMAWEEWFNNQEEDGFGDWYKELRQWNHPELDDGTKMTKSTRTSRDVIVDHIFTLETATIFALTVLLWVLFQVRHRQTRR